MGFFVHLERVLDSLRDRKSPRVRGIRHHRRTTPVRGISASRGTRAGIGPLIPCLALLVALVPSISSAQWTQQGPDIDGEAERDLSGSSVAISSDGSRLAIGAPQSIEPDIPSGYVRVYEWDDAAEVWVQLGSNIYGEGQFDHSGSSVALSSDGSRLAIGAAENDGTGSQSGHVRIFEWDGGAGNWVQLGPDIDGETQNDGSGFSVALNSDGSRVAVGAPYNGGTGSQSGHVRVYGWIGGDWVQRGSDIDGEALGDESGSSVALSSDGSRLAIGAPANNGINGAYSGHVRVFRWHLTTQRWLQLGPDIDGEESGGLSGTSVALSADGSRVVIGAPGNDGTGTDSGHARAYSWISPNWVQLGPDIDGEAAFDEFGKSVALSSDGSRLAVGAIWNSGSGTNSGHVRVFELGGPIGAMTWIQLGSDIDGEAAEDKSGYSVALSSNGLRLAVGAPENEDNGSDSGHVRVHFFGIFSDGFESGDASAW